MSRFRTSWTIARYSLDIMRGHPRLLAYPLASLMAFALIALFMIAPMELHLGPWQVVQALWSEEAREALFAAMGVINEPVVPATPVLSVEFIAYNLVSTFVMTFINVAFYGQIIAAMNGEGVSALKGYSQASQKLAAILAWTALSVAVSLVLRAGPDVPSFFGLVMQLAGLCWGAISIFIIPVMLNEPRSQTLFGYLKISTALLKRVWAEALIGVVAVVLVAVVMLIATMVINITLVGSGGRDAIPVAFLVSVGTGSAVFVLLFLALQVFECGLYVYATQGVAPGSFNPDTFDRTWTVRDASQEPAGLEPEADRYTARPLRWRKTGRALVMASVPVLGAGLLLLWRAWPSAPRIVTDNVVVETVRELPRLRPPDLGRSTPELDEKVLRAVLGEYPFLVQPQGSGRPVVVDMALRQDGSVYRSGLLYVMPDNRSAIMSDPSRQLPQQPDDVPGIIFRKAGQSGERHFNQDLWVRYVILADDPDASRDEAHVRSAMLAAHRDLLLPADGHRFNKVTVFLSEDGRVERHYVEPRTDDDVRPVGDQVPEVYGRLWAELGLQLDQLGPMGYTWIYAPLDEARPEGRMGRMVVRYAWQRRADEPIGGVPLSRRHPRIVPFLHADAAAVLEHFLPGALNDQGDSGKGTPWLVLSPRGEVVRSGYIKLEDEQEVDAALFEAGHPGQRIDLILESQVVKTYAESFARRVIFAWLKPRTGEGLRASSE